MDAFSYKIFAKYFVPKKDFLKKEKGFFEKGFHFSENLFQS